MSLLLITLAPGLPGAYDWAVSPDGQSVATHGSAAATLLPAASRGTEVLAVVPASQLSWHRVTLPRGVTAGSPRLRATLVGLLEESVLDDAEQLHFALAPDATAGAPAWVAVCDRAWLSAHLHALEAAQHPVHRIVPELAPAEGHARLWVTGDEERAQVAWTGDNVAGGVQVLPLGGATVPLLPLARHADSAEADAAADTPVFAEPAVAALAEQLLQRRVTLQQAPQRALQASRNGWDLAQGELAQSSRARTGKRMAAGWRDFVHAPAWRPARWGLALLLLAHLLGINAWAWRERADLQARNDQIRSALTQTFPQVKVVVDPPLQMARELAALRQAAGAASPRDLEPMLGALGAALTGAASATALEYSGGELRLTGMRLPASDLAGTNERLRTSGYALAPDGEALVLREVRAP